MGYSIFDETMVDMTWPEIERAAADGAIVLLPTGIIEEHGPHLGLAVDTYIAYLIGVMARRELASRGITALIAPPCYWGVSQGTAVFPGTFSVRRETMKALVYDILASLHGWGFKRVFAVNWHADFQHCRVCWKPSRRRGGEWAWTPSAFCLKPISAACASPEKRTTCCGTTRRQ